MASKKIAGKKTAKKYFFFVLKFLPAFLFLSWFFNIKIINDLLIGFFVFLMRIFLFMIGKGTVSIIDNTLVLNSVQMIMASECTGSSMYAMFIAFAFAYNISKKTLKHLLFGVLMLAGLNIIRIYTLLAAALLGSQFFRFFHDFLWPSSFFIFVLLVISYYIKESSR